MKTFFYKVASLSAFCFSLSAIASEYVLNPDGSSSYVGNCAVHLDYLGKGISEGKLIAPYISYPKQSEAQAWIAQLSAESQKLVYLAAQEAGLEDKKTSLEDIVQSFDDLKIFELNLDYYKATQKILQVVSYGVGGGNGGYMYFDKDNKLVAHTFDGDILSCNESYQFYNR